MKRGETYIPDGWGLDDSTYAWLRERHPSVDIGETFLVFVDKALAKGWSYRDWQAAFRNYIRNGMLYGGVIYRREKEFDPRWNCIHEARKHGFREPHDLESPGAYKTAFEQWKLAPKSNVVNFANVLKRVPH